MSDDKLHRSWRDVLSRMQQVANRQKTYAKLCIEIIVNSDGIPILWNEPEAKPLEPKSNVEFFDRITRIGNEPF